MEENEILEQLPETELVAPSGDSLDRQLKTVEIDAARFELAQRKATALCKSTLVPKDYRGASNMPNVLIAMEIASRMDLSELMVMQNLFVIHGRPSWSAQFLIGCFNTSGRFSPISYRFTEEGDGCRAVTRDLATDTEIEGTLVTMQMAHDEGWSTKTGSKWQTMPEQMLKYRAATFLIRSVAPEIGLGLYTAEEMEDID